MAGPASPELRRCLCRLPLAVRHGLGLGTSAWRPAAKAQAPAGRPAVTIPQLGVCMGAVATAGLLLQQQRALAETDAERAVREALGEADLEAPGKQRLHVVLDVDETLVRSEIMQRAPSSFRWGAGSTVAAECKGDGSVFGLVLPEGFALQVSKRPGLDSFLRWLWERGYEVSIYTAGTRHYAEALLPRLDPQGIIGQCLSREDCVPAPGLPNVYLKDLRRLRSICTGPDGRPEVGPTDLARTVLVDNNPLSFALQPENGILVSDWFGDAPDDDELERVKGLLMKLEAGQSCKDVRQVLPGMQGLEVRRLVEDFQARLRRSSL